MPLSFVRARTVPLARILIIEDDPQAAQLLQTLLRLEGYVVRTAADGAEGLATASEFDPHFVLLDLQLPVLHGIEVAQHLRINEQGLQRVIIGTTGLPTGSATLRLAFDHWLTKPIDADRLCELLKAEWRDRFAEAQMPDPLT